MSVMRKGMLLTAMLAVLVPCWAPPAHADDRVMSSEEFDRHFAEKKAEIQQKMKEDRKRVEAGKGELNARASQALAEHQKTRAEILGNLKRVRSAVSTLSDQIHWVHDSGFDEVFLGGHNSIRDFCLAIVSAPKIYRQFMRRTAPYLVARPNDRMHTPGVAAMMAARWTRDEIRNSAKRLADALLGWISYMHSKLYGSDDLYGSDGDTPATLTPEERKRIENTILLFKSCYVRLPEWAAMRWKMALVAREALRVSWPEQWRKIRREIETTD